ncbi:MAG: arginine--tRNA ligase [Candidatus Berkelbacteria bacterium]|nr:arginine--tRNA ligase [Candidatus Berkelbacteria bacterium]
MLDEINQLLKEILQDGIRIEFSRDGFGDCCLNPGQINQICKKQKIKVKRLIEIIKVELSKSGLAEKVEYKNGYINIYFSESAYSEELQKIENDIESYLVNSQNKDKTIVFDYSSPNIAKPFSVGHLRSTVIGQANLNIHKSVGFKTVGINHIGDWGTQFGKLIYAIKSWGDESEIEKDPIPKLNELYVKFHEEAQKNPQIEDQARAWSKKLEDGDNEARELWQKCVAWSFKEFDRIYKTLDVKIDEVVGESFYKDKQEGVIDELREKKLLKKSEDAQIVELENMPPALIKRSDDASLYMTRDLAALKYRIEKYKPAQIIYHVGNDQSLHFKQLGAVAKKLDWLDKTEIIFAGHGMMRLPEGKMSTRKGRIVLLDDLISKAKEKSLAIIEEKNSDLKNKKEVAEKIGISAIKYADLSSNRKSDIVFCLEKFINFQGNSGPYIQYSYARTQSLIRESKKKYPNLKIEKNFNPLFREVLQTIVRAKSVLDISSQNSSPNLIAEFAYQISNQFNAFYEKEKIITDSETATAKNMYLVQLTQIVLGKLFDVLGISKLEEI